MPPVTNGPANATSTASPTTAGVYRRANRSTNVCTGARCRCACLDQMNDSRDGAVGRRPARRDVDRAGAVDRPGKHVVAGPLLHRPRLAGDRRLIEGRFTGDDHAVHRQAIAGSNHEQVADADVADRHLPIDAVAADRGRPPGQSPSATGSPDARAPCSAIRVPAPRRTTRRPSRLRTIHRARRHPARRRPSAR